MFLSALTGGLLAAPLAAEAQQTGKVWRIAMLFAASSTDEDETRNRDALRDGLSVLGYAEGRNVVMDCRWAEGKLERLNGLAAELAMQKPDVIVAVSEPAAFAARRATTTIPIVMPISGDPAATGLATSLSRPGGNVTGLAMLKAESTPKQLQLLKEMRPSLKRIGLIFSETASDKLAVTELQQAAKVPGIQLYLAEARTPEGYASAFETLVKKGADGLIIVTSAAAYSHRQLICDLALRQRVPIISGLSEFARAGALMTYGPSQRAMFVRAASYVVKILQGASPAELPIEQPTKFELVINLKTAKALGLTIPPSLLSRADEVLQ